MKKTHIQFLGRAVNVARNLRDSKAIATVLAGIKGAKGPVHKLIIDIVGDARFFSVTDTVDNFWVTYGGDRILRFIDGLPEEIWCDEEVLTLAKEDFLNRWFLEHIMPMNAEERDDKLVALLTEEQKEKRDQELYGFGAKDHTLAVQPPEKKGLSKEMSDYMVACNRGSAPGNPHTAEATFLDSLPLSLVRLAEEIGRSGPSDSSKSGRFGRSTRSDIDGVTVGDDLSSVLPSEIAFLGDPATQSVFYQRFVRKRLQIFSSASHVSAPNPKKKSGPIFMCIDTSGSMTNEPEKMAKNLALAICIIAARKHRPVCLVNYSTDVSFFIMENYEAQKDALLSFLSHSYGGGNDEYALFKFAFEVLPKLPRYKRFGENFAGADLLVVSDFYWLPLMEESVEQIKRAREGGMRMYSLSVARAVEEDEPIEGAYDFQREAYGAYRYEDGDVIKISKRIPTHTPLPPKT